MKIKCKLCGIMHEHKLHHEVLSCRVKGGSYVDMDNPVSTGLLSEIRLLQKALRKSERIIEKFEKDTRWIPVSEKLPKMKNPEMEDLAESGELLVDWGYKNIDGEDVRRVELAILVNNTVWVRWDGAETNVGDPLAPTCWMYLPKLPQKSKNK